MHPRPLLRFLLILFTCVVTFPTASRADSVIFSNIATGLGYQPTVGLAAPNAGVYSPTGGTFDVAVSFTPSSDADLSQIVLPLVLESVAGLPTPPNDTTVELVNSVSGLPGPTVLESWSSIVLPTLTGSPPVTLTSTPGVFLASGTQYWIVVGTVGSDLWLLNDSGQINTFLLGSGTDWVTGGGLFEGPGYEVTGTSPIATPEPSSTVLLGVGLLGFAALRLRRSRFAQPRA